jgi:hypothetical protein
MAMPQHILNPGKIAMPTTEVNPLDFNADTGARIWRLLEINNVSFRNQLKQSSETAGAQLELAKPTVMGSSTTEKGKLFYAGPAVMFSPGTVFIVLAHHKKVFTIQIRSEAGHTIAEGIAEAVNYARELLGDEANKCTQGALGVAIEDLVKKYGRMPGKKGVKLDSEHNVRIVGSLFLPLSDASRAKTIYVLEQLVAVNTCPALIGLLGKGSQQGLSMAWPLPLALARYVDAVVKE